jgi:tricorn protease-like protein
VFSVNDSGTLVYQTGQAGTALTLYDRDGHELGPVGEHGIIFDVNISPDGKRVAVNRGEPADIWVYELGRGTSLRLTSIRATRRCPCGHLTGTRWPMRGSRPMRAPP